MGKGMIFDIEEFTIYDGPGIRTSVFFKGCPLHCQWCHNPEGLSFKPQIVRSPNGCGGCGECRRVCPSLENCILCGACVHACPNHLLRISGEQWEAEKLAWRLWSFEDFYRSSGGGITFSGGEVLAQPEFLLELLDLTRGLHRAIETSGYAPESVFLDVISQCDLVMMDLKVMDDRIHQAYIGVSNRRILRNFERLKASGVPMTVRIPLIPGVNDNEENFEAVAEAVRDVKDRAAVEILPYNAMAGAKYALLNMQYRPSFDAARKPESHFEPLTEAGIQWRIL